MNAAVLFAKNELRYTSVPDPKPLPDEVLVRVRATGICGSDIPRVLGDAAHFFPIVLGHEFSGEIVEVGKQVTSLQVGDRVAGAPLLPCRECIDCQKGDFSLCKNYSFIGSRKQGSFAEYVVLPAINAVKFSSDISFEQGALFEPSTVALHALFHTKFQGGTRVAIVGCGTIGLFAGQWARILGAGEIVALDIEESRLSVAKELFADQVLRSDTKEDLDIALASGGFDYVFDAVGGEATLRLSLQLAGNHAVVCLIGTPTKEVTLTAAQLEWINRKELWLTGSWMSYSAPFPGREWTYTSQQFDLGTLRIHPAMIAGTYPLSRVADAFARFAQPSSVQGRLLLLP